MPTETGRWPGYCIMDADCPLPLKLVGEGCAAGVGWPRRTARTGGSMEKTEDMALQRSVRLWDRACHSWR